MLAGRRLSRFKHDGLAFFDLKQLDQLVDSFIASVTDCISLGFSTIGETVVPVRHGKALYDAPMWNEQRITTNDAERSIIGQECPFEVTGLFQNGLLSLDKILWMRRNLPQVQEAETFLPMPLSKAIHIPATTESPAP